MPTVNLEIDGKAVEVPANSTVIEAATKLGIYVPHFCYHKKLTIAANCRMCLVQVEKAPKPLPACATPVTEGMKVFTHSPLAIQAQKGVMEFLLINHPLDCPICDQGGECQLQDLAVGYGASASRFDQPKRVVPNKFLGPLISTDMTRCIHCTRCVRFGVEVAGQMELGMVGRSEHAEIVQFIGKTVDSELSGNMIDVCPVGALTSKPFRFSARTWELTRRKTISPHCGLGSNLVAQVKLDRVLRVLPMEKEDINECWISDKDRFSYEGLSSPERLTRPMIKRGGKWEEVEWPIALEHVAQGLRGVRDAHGASAIAALASPHSTFEELFLLQRLMRGLGTDNVDFRLRQSDFALDGKRAGAPWLGMPVADLSLLDRVLIVGSQVRKDHPLLAHRFRDVAKRNGQINLLNVLDDDQLIRTHQKLIVSPANLCDALAQIVKAAAQAKSASLPPAVAAATISVKVGEAAQRIADSLASGANAAVFLGNLAQHHPQASQLHMLASALAQVCGIRVGFLGEAANSVGGYMAKALPADASAGLNADQMLAKSQRAYVLLHAELELESGNPSQAMRAMSEADFVVALSPFRHKAVHYADVLLPIAPFTETAGSFINTEGRLQTFSAVARTLGETRPAWKVLRVLGNLFGLAGFGYDTAEDVRADAVRSTDLSALSNDVADTSVAPIRSAGSGGLQRIADVPIYFADPLVRRSEPLQETVDAAGPLASMSGETLQQLGVNAGDTVRITQEGGEAVLIAVRDDRIPRDCVRVPAAHVSTSTLGSMFGTVQLERVASEDEVSA